MAREESSRYCSTITYTYPKYSNFFLCHKEKVDLGQVDGHQEVMKVLH